MPPLKPINALTKQKQAETALLASVVNDTATTAETSKTDDTPVQET